jgi:hypothetical protein
MLVGLANTGNKVLGTIGFLARLPIFLRAPIYASKAQETLRQRWVSRRADFENFIATAIYGDVTSPYLALLRMAGCEHGDFTRLIASEGVEGSLAILARQGVYLSIDEFKGRTPAVRGSAVLHIDPRLLAKPASPFHLSLRSGGSRGRGSEVPVDLAYIRDRAISTCVAFEARGGRQWVHGVWGMWGRGSMAVLLELSAFGAYPEFWFTQADPQTPSMSPLYRWSAHAIRLSASMAGIGPLQIQHVAVEEAVKIAHWMAEVLKSGRTPHLHTHASSAVLVCEQASAAALDIRGAQFTAASEPMTEARLHAIERTGARAWPQYASVETGVIGLACLEPARVDDIHLLHDRFAMIQSEAESNLPVDSLLLSSLRQSTAPFNLLNVSLGDQATLEKRSCGCVMEQIGWQSHLHTIRSQEKLTALGMNFLDKDVIRVLEEILPARFGGGPTDYQLIEEISADGHSRLRLLVEPALGPFDSQALRETFLTAIGAGSDSEHIMSQLWRSSEILGVERLTPRKTGAGKILHVHQQRTGQ